MHSKKAIRFLILPMLFFSSLAHGQEELPLYSCRSYAMVEPSQIPILSTEPLWFRLDSVAGLHGSVSGKILNQNEEALEGAEITLEGSSLKAISNAKGQYTFDSLSDGHYTIHISHTDGMPCELPLLVIEKGKHYSAPSAVLSFIEIQTEKPIIYLYPEQKQEVVVEIEYKGILTHTYPRYNEGWKITAFPDGTLVDTNNRSYYALFWEGVPSKAMSTPNGFLVKGSESIAFLEEKLALLGLTDKEANEFILYWLPRLEVNEYNFIHFAQEEYLDLCDLKVEPKPDTEIRVMMVWEALEAPLEFEQQILPPTPIRKGFTLVEWGGSQSKSKKKLL
jgi:hypothetical protein